MVDAKSFLKARFANMVDYDEKYVYMEFIHNEKHITFYSLVNIMTGNRLTSFNNEPPRIDDSMNWVKKIIKGIKSKSKVNILYTNIDL